MWFIRYLILMQNLLWMVTCGQEGQVLASKSWDVGVLCITYVCVHWFPWKKTIQKLWITGDHSKYIIQEAKAKFDMKPYREKDYWKLGVESRKGLKTIKEG